MHYSIRELWECATATAPKRIPSMFVAATAITLIMPCKADKMVNKTLNLRMQCEKDPLNANVRHREQ